MTCGHPAAIATRRFHCRGCCRLRDTVPGERAINKPHPAHAGCGFLLAPPRPARRELVKALRHWAGPLVVPLNGCNWRLSVGLASLSIPPSELASVVPGFCTTPVSLTRRAKARFHRDTLEGGMTSTTATSNHTLRSLLDILRPDRSELVKASRP